MTDNCGNCIVWMRPDVLDDIGNDVAHGEMESALAVLVDIKKQFESEAKRYFDANNVPI